MIGYTQHTHLAINPKRWFFLSPGVYSPLGPFPQTAVSHRPLDMCRLRSRTLCTNYTWHQQKTETFGGAYLKTQYRCEQASATDGEKHWSERDFAITITFVDLKPRPIKESHPARQHSSYLLAVVRTETALPGSYSVDLDVKHVFSVYIRHYVSYRYVRSSALTVGGAKGC